ncbi:MAG: DUF4124 domain-containing protein [Candidatus Thiodiazotropha sp.]
MELGDFIPSRIRAWPLVLLIGVSLCAAEPLGAGVYRWTDAQGQVHYSDRPVGESAREVPIRKSPKESLPKGDDAQRQERTRRMLEVYQEDREKKQEALQKQIQEREKRQRNCIVARDRYQSHSQASGIYSFKKDGDRQYLDDAARQKYMQKLKAEIDKWCR